MKTSLLLFSLFATSYSAFGVDLSCELNPFTELENIKEVVRRIPTQCSEEKPKKIPADSKVYFEELLKLGKAAPIEKFLKLWDKDRPSFEDDPYFFECEKKAWSYMSKTKFFGLSKMMVNKCKPDVLYSWGSEAKKENIFKTLTDGELWSGPANPHKQMAEFSSKKGTPVLYMALTPASTYGYGSNLMRIKIKKETPFRSQKYNANNGEIGFWKDQLAQDFTLTDSSVIESISSGTAEIYDEVIRDLLRIKSNKRAQLYFYDPKDQADSKRTGLDKLTGIGQLDNTYFTEDLLKENLLKLIETILKEDGKVHYQKGTCRSYQQHYKTDKPTYFNPD